MEYLLIGDMHVTEKTISENERLIRFCFELCQNRKLIPVFMGDQFDTHSLIKLDVLDFWRRVYIELMPQYEIYRSITLTGNHDLNHARTLNTLSVFSALTTVVDKKLVFLQDAPSVYAIGYCNRQDFLNEISKISVNQPAIVLCHQDFLGARTENGYVLPDGLSPRELPPNIVFISGHIHTHQILGDRIFYVGTPRQINYGDLDSFKNVWVLKPSKLTHDTTFADILEPIAVPESVSPKFKVIKITDDDPNLPVLPNDEKIIVELHTTREKAHIAANILPPKVKIKLCIKDDMPYSATFSEKEGIGQAFQKYLDFYCQNNNLSDEDKTKILEKIKEHVNFAKLN